MRFYPSSLHCIDRRQYERVSKLIMVYWLGIICSTDTSLVIEMCSVEDAEAADPLVLIISPGKRRTYRLLFWLQFAQYIDTTIWM